jgi:hypothetical protein
MYRSVIRLVTKIYYLKLLRASEGTLSCWSRLHLQSITPTPVSRKVDVRQAAGRKNNCRILIIMMKNMLYRPHLVWDKGRKKMKNRFIWRKCSMITLTVKQREWHELIVSVAYKLHQPSPRRHRHAFLESGIIATVLALPFVSSTFRVLTIKLDFSNKRLRGKFYLHSNKIQNSMVEG